jgi:DNA recombination protein RmuC
MNEIILLVIGLAIGSALGYFIGVSKKLKSSDLSQQSGLASQISEMKGEIKGIFTEIEKSRDRSEDRRDAKLQDMSNTIDSFNRTISGTKTRGMVGESILKETLKNSIKVGVVKTELKIGSKNVEFAWDLGDGKYIPIDSKLPDVVSLVNKYELSKDTEEQKLLSKKLKIKWSRKFQIYKNIKIKPILLIIVY